MSLYKGLKGTVNCEMLLAPADITTTAPTTKASDMQELRGYMVDILTGAITGGDASNYLTPTLQESDDLTSANFADIAAADYEGGVAPAKLAASSQVRIGYIGSKRYVRVKLTRTGSGVTNALVAVLGILQSTDVIPLTDRTPGTPA